MLALSPFKPATYTSTNLNHSRFALVAACLPPPCGESRGLAGLAGAAVLANPLFAGNARAFHL
jgi:hypothetical protein